MPDLPEPQDRMHVQRTRESVGQPEVEVNAFMLWLIMCQLGAVVWYLAGIRGLLWELDIRAAGDGKTLVDILREQAGK